MQPPRGCLQNPSNLCYLNASAQAFAWVGQLVDREDLCYGKVASAMKPVLSVGKPLLPNSLAWHVVLRGWSELHRQHDVCQFMMHLVEVAEPKAYRGSWQARLTNPDVTVDAGSLQAPILLDLPGRTVAELVQSWHAQHALYALHQRSGVISLQIKRYRHTATGQVKDASPLKWQPGERIAMPIFCDSVGVQVRFEYFRIVFAICHLGQCTQSGHYQTVVCVPKTAGVETATEPTGWHGFVLNDNSRPRKASPRDADMLERNCYLLGLVFDPGR